MVLIDQRDMHVETRMAQIIIQFVFVRRNTQIHTSLPRTAYFQSINLR